jgi:hypothetical protein
LFIMTIYAFLSPFFPSLPLLSEPLIGLCSDSPFHLSCFKT